MFKFMMQTSKKLAMTAFDLWKDKKVSKTREFFAMKLDAVVDGSVFGVRLVVFLWILCTCCAAGACVLIPIAYCASIIGGHCILTGNSEMGDVIYHCSTVLWTIGITMVAVLVVVFLLTAFVSGKVKNNARAKIDSHFRN